MDTKEKYTVEEIFEDLPCTLVELGDKAGLNEVTIARIRDGKPTRRSSVNRLMLALTDIYKRPLSLHNVTGINVQRNLREERKQARQEGKAGQAA
ncbi:MAG: hypothetical protein J2P37_00130 [Ktedonobacteraceae bacterium]|nr:hypothetical protein [Ktedonobacteraceae bacterium]